MAKVNLILLMFLSSIYWQFISTFAPEQETSRCQVCKYLAKEIEVETKKTSISKDVLHTGGFDTEFRNRKIPYQTSEVRFIEIVDGACENILKYRVHADKKERYLKGTSTTMNTLFGLKRRGVKVELGVPDEMWDDIPAEVSKMKRKCDALREEFEDELMEWYLHYQDEDLMEWLCRMRALPPDQHDCLTYYGDTPVDKEDEDKEEDSSKDGEKEKDSDKEESMKSDKDDHEGESKGEDKDKREEL